MIKYFCDVCEAEVPEPYCLYTIGWILCSVCYPLFVEEHTKNGILVIPKPPEPSVNILAQLGE